MWVWITQLMSGRAMWIVLGSAKPPLLISSPEGSTLLPAASILTSEEAVISAGYTRSNAGAARGHDPNKFDWPALLRKLDRIDPSYKQ